MKHEVEAMLYEMCASDAVAGVRVIAGEPAKTPDDVPAPKKQLESCSKVPTEIVLGSAPAPPGLAITRETVPEFSPPKHPELRWQTIHSSNERVVFANGRN